MKPRFLAPLLALSLLASCSGGASLQDYFSELSRRNAALDDRAQQARSDAQRAFTGATSVEGAATAMTDFLAELTSIGETAVTGLEDLDPPDEVKEQHDAYLVATKDLLAAFQSMRADIEAADPSQVGGVVRAAGSEIDAKTRAVDEACMDLQAAADDNDIEADLKCSNPSDAPDTAAQSGLGNASASPTARDSAG